MSLKNLLSQISPQDTAALKKEVRNLFGQVIEDEINKIKPKSWLSVPELFDTALAELTQIIEINRPAWFALETDILIAQTIPSLVKACQWKLYLPTYSSEESRKKGAFLATNLLFHLEKYNEDATPTRRKRLIGYLSEKDKNIIVARTLRAIIPFLTNKTKFNFFQLTPSYQLTLQEGLVGKYLYEQTALYVYMFIDQREGGFLEDAWNYVRRHVQGRLRKSSIPDYEQVAQDVVQDAMNLFLKKRNEYAKRPEGFFIDQRIESYFVGLIRSYKLITACFRKNRKTVYFGEEIEEKLLGTDNAHGDSLNESETLSRIVRSCVNDQIEKCRALLLTRYWSAFSQPLSYREIVSEADVALRTIERQMPGCEADLRACIVYKTSMQGLRF